jgi:hypothetical protein
MRSTPRTACSITFCPEEISHINHWQINFLFITPFGLQKNIADTSRPYEKRLESAKRYARTLKRRNKKGEKEVWLKSDCHGLSNQCCFVILHCLACCAALFIILHKVHRMRRTFQSIRAHTACLDAFTIS